MRSGVIYIIPFEKAIGHFVRIVTFVVLMTALLIHRAHADPCKAIPDRGRPDPAIAALLRPGATFTGPVAHVIDGDGLCVEVGAPGDPKGWVEVRLADWYAPELHERDGPQSKVALARLALHRRATCTVRLGDHGSARSYDRVIATCAVGGRPLAGLLRDAGMIEGGRGW